LPGTNTLAYLASLSATKKKKEVFMTLSPGPQWWIRFPAKLSLLHLQMDQEIAKSLQIYFNLTFSNSSCVAIPSKYP
jgi:hypothetical protein